MAKARRTVLIVGGDSQEKEIYRQYLQQDNNDAYIIWEEQSSQRGVELCHQLQPDAVLLNLSLSIKDDLVFLAQIKTQKIISSVVVLTQQQDESITAQVIENGAQNCLIKTQISPPSLRYAVHGAIETTNLRRSLQQISERLDTITEIAQICSWEWDILTDEVWLSKNFASLFGMESATFVKTSNAWLEIVHPQDRELVRNIIAETHEKNLNYFHEYRLLLDGKISWVRCQGNIFYDEVDKPVKMVGTIQDITDIKNSEEKLEKSRDFIQQISDATPGILYIFDLSEKRTIYINNQITQVLGYTQKFVEEMGAEFTNQLMHPEDRLRLASHIEQFNCADPGAVFNFEYRMRHANGEWRWFTSRDRIFKYSEDGLPLQIIGNAQDITEHKHIEKSLRLKHEQFQLATMALNCFVYDWDIPRNYIERTQGLFEVLGYTESEVIPIPQWLETIIHESDRPRVEEEFKAALENGNRYSIEYRLSYKQEPRYMWVRDTGFAMRNGDGCVVRIAGIIIDISENKEYQAKLQDTIEQVKLATAAAQLGMWFWNITTDELIWTEKCKALFGLSPDAEVNYEVFLDCLHPDDREYTREAVTRTLVENIGYNVEYRTVWADGTIHWLSAKGNSFYDSQGKVVRMMGTVQDISERKHIEESLATNQERLELAQKAGQIGVYDWDILIGEITWTEQQEIIFGLTPGSFGGRIDNWRELVLPEDLIEVEQSLQQTILNQIQNWEAEFRIFYKGTDDIRWIAGKARFFYDEFGKPLRMIGTNIDITDRKITEEALQQSQAHLNSFVEANVIGILFGDVDGGIHKANDEFLRIIGYDRQDLEPGKISWTDITPPEYLPLDATGIAEAKRTGACKPYEKEYIRQDGTRTPVLIGYTLVGEAKRESVAFILDLSASKRMEAALRENEERYRYLADKEKVARAQAEAANRAKDDFVAMVSHDLRSPLNSILGWAKLLRTGKVDQNTTAKALETIERCAKSQSRLIEDLLDISRMIQGRLDLACMPVNLASVIKVTIEQVSLLAIEKQIQIESRIDISVGMISGDFHRLQQILENLLSNAIKFTPIGGRVEVCLESIDYQKVQIRVIDNGKGISPEFLPHVFDRFRQQEPTTRNNGGLGLGLAIVSHLVELHNGTVTAESQGEGKGATFIIQLPLIVSNLESSNRNTQDNEIQQKSKPIGSMGLVNNLKILVVDDEADNREMMKTLLAKEGADVTTAATAQEALQKIRQIKPNILISDIGMPIEDGYSLIRKIRALSKEEGGQIPAVAVTAYITESDRLKAMEAGFQMHLGKPIEPKQLLQVLVNLMDIGQ